MEEVLNLGFGRCRLQVQVPEKGKLERPEELVGKNVVTSFVGLTERYFAKLEGLEGIERDGMNEDVPLRNRLKTKIKYVGGSVEAACALGVADGIVDLVGKTISCGHKGIWTLSTTRIRGDDESSRPESHRHRRREHSHPDQIQTSLQSKARRHDCLSNKRGHQ